MANRRWDLRSGPRAIRERDECRRAEEAQSGVRAIQVSQEARSAGRTSNDKGARAAEVASERGCADSGRSALDSCRASVGYGREGDVDASQAEVTELEQRARHVGVWRGGGKQVTQQRAHTLVGDVERRLAIPVSQRCVGALAQEEEDHPSIARKGGLV